MGWKHELNDTFFKLLHIFMSIHVTLWEQEKNFFKFYTEINAQFILCFHIVLVLSVKTVTTCIVHVEIK